MKRILVSFLSLIVIVNILQAKTVKGRVSSEGKSLSGIIVSDGYRFTRTDAKGAFKLSTHKDARFVFVVTPSGYVADFSSGAPAFYLPIKGTRSFDFVLQKFSDSPDYTIFSVSDPQMQNDMHLKRFREAPLGDLRGMAARCKAECQTVGIALGDIGWNVLEIHSDYKKAIATTGIPFYSVIGNHDFIQTRSGIAAGEAYESSFGPYNYAFFLGGDLVIGLNNIEFAASGNPDPSKSSNEYREGYPRETLDFLKGLLAMVPKGTHLLIAQHSPAFEYGSKSGVNRLDEFISILDGYNVDILSGHSHIMHNRQLTPNILDHNAAAIGGAWWATDWCRDGTPRGYEIFMKRRGDFTWRWHNIDYPDEFQVEFIPMGKAVCHPNDILANVWDSDSNWNVSWSEDGSEWQKAELVADVSPKYVSEIMEVYKGDFDKIPGYKKPFPTPHYYAASPSQYARVVMMKVQAPDGRQWSQSFTLDGYIDLQAHRGGAGLMPENTISSMKKAMDLRVNTLEFDLHVSGDGQVVVSHDSYFHPRYSTRPDGSLVKKDDPKEYLYKMPYDSIAKYDVGLKFVDRWPTQQKLSEHKPLASDLIDFAERYAKEKGLSPMRYNIEIKSLEGKGEGENWPEYHEFVDKCLPVLLSKNLGDRLVVQSFDRRALEYIHSKYPQVRLSLLTDDDEKEIAEILSKMSFLPDWWSPHFSVVTKENVAYCHALGLKVVPWTVDEEEDILRIAGCSVDAIISNYPDRLIKLLRELGI
ncbi:MAG: calcineurin-like phosphoesterase C-terminal domain-containing protein [Bacteroidales bacterium]|nr:calcineurin-like phosphoesterase C-terminal domain-containing protein [Bacteroidales bacterium]